MIPGRALDYLDAPFHLRARGPCPYSDGEVDISWCSWYGGNDRIYHGIYVYEQCAKQDWG